jgi:hypothetical protein
MIFQFDEIVNLPSGSGCCVTESRLVLEDGHLALSIPSRKTVGSTSTT